VIWLVPNVIDALLTGGGDINTFNNFLKDYYIGFHFQFFLHRAKDTFIMFDKLLYYPGFLPLVYILPGIYAVLVVLEKDIKKRIRGYLIALWFVVPWIGFTIYGGSLSEYYYLYNAPMVLYIFVYIQQKLLNITKIPALPTLIILGAIWGFYIYQNTYDLWIKPAYGGLAKQKDEVRVSISKGQILHYNEGDIKTYLYEIWVRDKKKE
jgi:4-amino-4-deoxy-L-arabinose transferase-like glycosyltransferase